MTQKRKICVVTGTRAEYGLLRLLMKELQLSKKVEFQLLVTGMHLDKKFGTTIKEIEKDGFLINNVVRMTAKDDTPTSMVQTIGKGVVGIVNSLEKLKPDILVLLGDRTEALAAAIATTYSLDIVLVHIHGGDSARAGLDEYTRHAITKLAHVHFPATKLSAERIIKMGEEESRVFMVGAPGLDEVLTSEYPSREEISKKYNLDLSLPSFLVVQHPVTTERELAVNQMKKTMEVLTKFKNQTVVVYPNADAGGRQMISVIEQYRSLPFIQIHKSLPRNDYLALMNIVSVMIGNSSSGIIEASSFHLPVINIGGRQEGRERADNVIDIGHDKKELVNAIEKVLHDEEFRKKVEQCESPYGNGTASKKMAEILTEIKIDKRIFQKKLTY